MTREHIGSAAQDGDIGFSVVIPVYNRRQQVARAIDSVLKQSFANFEVLVVDDGSTDGTADAVRKIEDSRLRLLQTDGRVGAGAARNLGVLEARQPFVAFLDSDDEWMLKKLERTADVISPLRRDAMVVLFNRVKIRRDTGYSVSSERAPTPGQPISEFLFLDRGFIQTSAVALSSSLAKRVRFDGGLSRLQDWDFYLRLEAAGARFQFIPDVLTLHDGRTIPDRISSSSDPEFLRAWLDDRRSLISDRAVGGFRLLKVVPELIAGNARSDAWVEFVRSRFWTHERARFTLVELGRLALPQKFFSRLTQRRYRAKIADLLYSKLEASLKR